MDWPDGQRRLHGKGELRAYWVKQWALKHTHDRVLSMGRRADGRVAVRLNRVVRSLDGHVLEDAIYDYVFRNNDSRILRLDIEQT